MTDKLKILFLGDITGRPGRTVVEDYLTTVRARYDFVIANVENASHGFGLTLKNHNELKNMGIDCFTSGNHIWDKKEVFQYIDSSDVLVRPYNYPKTTIGEGYKIFEVKGVKLAVSNFLGATFMNPVNSPWDGLEDLMQKLQTKADIVFVDFHAEATAEKLCFGQFCNQKGVTAMVGTHTHIPTADEKILTNGCAYITDVGFCGDNNGIIGMDFETSFKRFTTQIPQRFEVADSKEYCVNAVEIIVDKNTLKSIAINRLSWVKLYEKGMQATESNCLSDTCQESSEVK